MSQNTANIIPESDETPELNLPPTHPSLSTFTSHLAPNIIKRGLDPGRWSPVYLTALRISVKTKVESEKILEPLSCGQPLLYDRPARLELIKVLSKPSTFSISSNAPNSLTSISMVIWDILYSHQVQHNMSEHVLKLFEHMITYMITYLKVDVTRKINISLRSRPGGLARLIYRGSTGKFISAASLYPVYQSKAPRCTPQLPLLDIVIPGRQVDHYAQEIAHLLSLAQNHYLASGDQEDAYWPYILTIRGTRVSILAARVSISYLESVEEMEVRSKGLKVLVSEEFDIAIMEGRVKFLIIFEELLVGLVLRDSCMSEREEGDKESC